MKSTKPWVNALAIDQEEYQRWCETMPANTSVTFWCLAKGYVSPGHYLQWAQEHYGLATLRPEFFETQPNKKVFTTLKSVANWSPEMIPVAEWDGVVFIACVEPIDMQWSFPVCYVLASSQELQDYWENLSEATQIAPAPPAVPSTSLSISQDDAPGGLNLNLQPVRKEVDLFGQLAAQVGEQDEIPTQIKPLPADDMPAGISLNLSTAMPPMPEQTFTAIKFDSAAFATPAAQTFVMPPAPTITTPLNAPVVASNVTAIDAASGSPTSMSEQGKLFGGQFFRDMSGEFDGGMILLGDGNSLSPWSWDESFAPEAHHGPSVDLSKPSAFRIAYRTKMPYLGHVVETPTNTEFFKGWGYMQMPENIVAYPLIQEGTFFGVLLLKAKKSQKQSHLLASSEQFALRISSALSQLKIKAA